VVKPKTLEFRIKETNNQVKIILNETLLNKVTPEDKDTLIPRLNKVLS
jgi:hypothetical protein